VHVFEDARPFVSGLSDDAGGGAALGLGSRVALSPTVLQASRLDDYIAWTFVGPAPGTKNGTTAPYFSLQDPESKRILMTIFFYQKPGITYNETLKCVIGPSWCAFNEYPIPNQPGWEPASYRFFNYPHQLSVFYALYHVARDWDGLAAAAGLRLSWGQYLSMAADTLLTLACPNDNTGTFGCLPETGVMDGTVFRSVLIALEQEAAAGSPSPGPFTWSQYAANVTKLMTQRVFGDGTPGWAGWANYTFEMGSEFSFDTTGQEELAVWGAYYNAPANWPAPAPPGGDLATRVRESILAFEPSQPVYALHGSAYGMGDFSNGGKWMVQGGWEREGGHYRAGLNSIPLVEGFWQNPDDPYLLHVGVGGITSVLPNFDENGAPSLGFHTYPFVQAHDPNSADFGLGFFGHSTGAAAALVNHTLLGWRCFLCNAVPGAGATSVTIFPRDSFRVRVFVEFLGLFLRAWTGAIDNVVVDLAASTVTVTFEAPGAPSAAWDAEYRLANVRETEQTRIRPELITAPEAGATPYSFYRLEVTNSAPGSRPFTFTLTAPAGAQLVRGAWQWPVQSPTEVSVATITWA
jgi:hypothetical protein